jgi:hypothetical protein
LPLAQKLVFCSSGLDKSTTAPLKGVHLIGVCLMGVYLMSVHLMGVHLIGMCLIGVHLMDMCLLRVFLARRTRVARILVSTPRMV